MPTLILSSDTDCAVTLNGVFQGAIYNNKEISLPLINNETVICACAFNENYLPVTCLITPDPVRLQAGSAQLYKWNEEIYQLSFLFTDPLLSAPPVILKEKPWAKGFLGLCGNYLVFEDNLGRRKHFDTPVIDFEPFNDYCVIAKTHTHIIPLNNNLAPICPPLPCREYSFNNGTLKTMFYPGDMDFIEVHQSYNNELSLIDTKISAVACQSVFDHLRLFCQAVRLEIKDIAQSYLTPELKQEMNFDNIKNFLGIFDQTDKPKYLANLNENAVALRYKIDSRNFHYMCYEFNITTTTGTPLIDDIREL